MLLKFNTEAEWLEARKRDITSTEIAALFGLSPYKSRLKLWHIKKGDIEDDFEESSFSKWGRRLQIPVALGICEDEGWKGEDLTGLYFTEPDLRLGSSMDVLAICQNAGRGLLEVKVADQFREDDGWTQDAAPIPYEFQIQTQLHLAEKNNQDLKWGAIGTLGRRQSTRLYMREYDRDLGAIIDEEVAKFWASIEANEPPPPDYAVDADLLEKMQKPLRSGDIINLTMNNRAHELVARYEAARAELKGLKDLCDAPEQIIRETKAELHKMIGRNEVAIIGDVQINARTQYVEDKVTYGYSFRRFDLKQRKKGK